MGATKANERLGAVPAHAAGPADRLLPSSQAEVPVDLPPCFPCVAKLDHLGGKLTFLLGFLCENVLAVLYGPAVCP